MQGERRRRASASGRAAGLGWAGLWMPGEQEEVPGEVGEETE